MMIAVKKFNPDKGARLATYASWWIKATIQEYILHNWSMVKIGTTHDQKKLFFKLKSTKEKIGALEKGDLTQEHVKQIASKLNVNEKEVVSMNRRLAGVDMSLNAPVNKDGQEITQWEDWITDDKPSAETITAESQEIKYRKSLLESALNVLKERELEIIKSRRLTDNPKTLNEISKKYNVSIERIRQIEAQAFTKLQKEMQRLAILQESKTLLLK